MPLSRRYTPEFAPFEKSIIGYDFSPIIPPGVGIASGTLSIYTNTNPPVLVDTDFQVDSITVRGRALYCLITGGIPGRDYQFRWIANDLDGNTFVRTGLLLVADTS